MLHKHSLRAGRSDDRIPVVGARYSVPFKTGATSLPAYCTICVSRLDIGRKAAGA
jgi:hypothetical protein